MSFELKKNLSVLSIVCFLSFMPVFAENEYNSETLEGYIQELKMTDLNPDYIFAVDDLLNKQMDEKKFIEAETTASYYIDITKKYYGSHSEQAVNAYLKRAMLYRNYIMPDKALKDLNDANAQIKWIKDDLNLKESVNNSYADFYSSINQPYDSIGYIEKIPEKLFTDSKSLGNKYKREAELYDQAGDRKKSFEYYNKAIDIYNKDYNENKYELINAYTNLARIVNIQKSSQYLNQIDSIVNSLPSDDIGARIDATINKLNYLNIRGKLKENKRLLDNTAMLVKKHFEPYRDIGIAFLYIDYYNELNNKTMVAKYEKILKKYEPEDIDWSKIPKSSLLWERKYEEAINSSFNNPDEAQKHVNYALNKIEPVKKYVPVMYSKFLLKGAQVNMMKSDFTKALQYLNDAEKTLKKASNAPKQQLAELYRNYYELYSSQGNLKKSLEYLNKSIEYSEITEAFSYSDLYGTKANLYYGSGNKDEAFKFQDKMIDEAKKEYGENYIRTYEIMFNVWSFYSDKDKAKADEIFIKIFNDIENGKVLGKNPFLFSQIYYIKASDSFTSGNYKDAVKYGEKALKYTQEKEQKKDIYNLLKDAYSNIPGKSALAVKYKKLSASIK